MNPRLGLLQPYPFEKLRELLAGIAAPAGVRPINLYIGEPQHPTPALIKDKLSENLGALARYPLTRGLPELRQAIVDKVAAEKMAKTDVVQTYTMTRRLLSFALVSYLAAFSAVFYYLFTSGG